MLNLNVPRANELKPRIVVIGVGGAGGNAVNNMIEAGLQGVDFVVANTDAQALAHSRSDARIQLGTHITQGLGAGMRPHVGEQAAEDSLPEIMEHLEGVHMLFIAAGMGGGTGTGAAPVIARAAREKGILTVAVVTKPFQFEGSKRMKLADEGLERLQPETDTLIVIPNQNLFRVATESTTIMDAFSMADEVLHSGVRGVTDLMVVPGLMNLDFADVRTVMDEMGKAMMGTGEASGERRAVEAAQTAITNPLLDDVSLKGAKGVLINITGGRDLTLYEVDEAANLIRSEVDPEANIIVGSTMDEDLEGIVRVSVVATGVEADEMAPRVDNTARPARETYARPVAAAQPQPEPRIETRPEPEEIYEPPLAEVESDDIVIETIEEPEYDVPSEPVAVIDATNDYDVTRRFGGGYHAPEEEVAEAHEPEPEYYDEPEMEAEPEQETGAANIIRRPFSLFGRKKSAPKRPVAKPAPAAQKTPEKTRDLFDDDYEEELEIPAFLRR